MFEIFFPLKRKKTAKNVYIACANVTNRLKYFSKGFQNVSIFSNVN